VRWGGRTGTVRPFVDRLTSVFSRRRRTLVLDHETIASKFPRASADLPVVADWLNAAENDYDLIVYVADDSLTAWTQKAIRQADQVVIAVTGAAIAELNPVEELAFRTHRQTHRRLVVIHERRQRAAAGTPAWLASRPVFMHHHVAIEDDVDFASFHRFLIGRAIGYVAGGGGGFGPAHVGIFKAYSRARRVLSRRNIIRVGFEKSVVEAKTTCRRSSRPHRTPRA
jgi:NTE family protein